eukprot:SAG11_NODE_770_length_7257_cov_2.448449_12_plen_71_part_00
MFHMDVKGGRVTASSHYFREHHRHGARPLTAHGWAETWIDQQLDEATLREEAAKLPVVLRPMRTVRGQPC